MQLLSRLEPPYNSQAQKSEQQGPKKQKACRYSWGWFVTAFSPPSPKRHEKQQWQCMVVKQHFSKHCTHITPGGGEHQETSAAIALTYTKRTSHRAVSFWRLSNHGQGAH